MNSGENELPQRANTPVWEDRWVRFARGLTERGVDAGKQEFHFEGQSLTFNTFLERISP
jgi:hypothetical protein